jgi:hypothetical protein
MGLNGRSDLVSRSVWPPTRRLKSPSAMTMISVEEAVRRSCAIRPSLLFGHRAGLIVTALRTLLSLDGREVLDGGRSHRTCIARPCRAFSGSSSTAMARPFLRRSLRGSSTSSRSQVHGMLRVPAASDAGAVKLADVRDSNNLARVWFSAPNVVRPVARKENMPTLIVILDDGTERRIPEVIRAVENNDAVVALNEQNHVKARFALRDVRSWYVEEDQQ